MEHQRGPQEVVPGRDEGEDGDRRQRRTDERQHDRPPDPPLPRPVDAGRVDEVPGHTPEGLAQQEDVEGTDEVGQDQRRQRVVVVEHVDRQHEARDVRQLGGHDQGGKERVEDRVTTKEAHLRERIRGHRDVDPAREQMRADLVDVLMVRERDLDDRIARLVRRGDIELLQPVEHLVRLSVEVAPDLVSALGVDLQTRHDGRERRHGRGPGVEVRRRCDLEHVLELRGTGDERQQ